VSCPGNCSWSWRKILGLRSITRKLICHRVGGGRSTSLWFDNWHPMGPLMELFEGKDYY
jgi:hypothetical protein